MTTPFEIDPRIARVILPSHTSHKEWAGTRRNGVGGSDIASAVGVDHWRTPYQMWLIKTGRVDPDRLTSSEQENRFRWGHKIEPLLIDTFAEEHPDLHVTRDVGTLARVDQKWQRVNVDGLAWTQSGELHGVIEAKTANHRMQSAWEGAEVPVPYVMQCQWAMWVTGAPRAYVVALIDTHTHIEKTVERDDELIADLVDLATQFWRLVEIDTPPTPDGKPETQRMLASTPTEQDSYIDLDPTWEKTIQRRTELVEHIAVLTREKDILDNQLRDAMGEHETAYLLGERVATHKRSEKPNRTIDRAVLDELRDLFPDVYAQVVTERPASRRLHYTTRRGTSE